MKRKICILLTALILVSFTACGNNNIEETDTEATMIIGMVEEDVFEIKTEYCTLKYPNEWKDKVTVEVEEDAVSFTYTATGVRVFDIAFGEGEGYVLGVIRGNDMDTAVRIVNYELDSTSAEYQTYCAIVENVNVIINHLSSDYDFS